MTADSHASRPNIILDLARSLVATDWEYLFAED